MFLTSQAPDAMEAIFFVVNFKESIMNSLVSAISRFLRDEEGVTAIEYGLIAALIAVVIIAAVTLVGTRLSCTFNRIAACLINSTSAACTTACT